MNDTPIIRVEIDGIRKTLLKAMTAEQGHMEAAIREVFSNFNFRETIQAEVRRLLPDMVREMTKRAVESSMYTLQHDMQPLVTEMVRNGAKTFGQSCGCRTGCKNPNCDKA